MFYAVRKGKTPGVYNTWDDAKAQVDGFKGAEYKKFKSEEDAHSYVNGINIRGKYVYAVRNTNQIFHTWEECKAVVNGMTNAEYKKFSSESEANHWLAGEEFSFNEFGINTLIPTIYVSGRSKNESIGFGILLNVNDSESAMSGRTSGKIGCSSGELTAFALSLKLLNKLNIREANVVYSYEGVENFINGVFKTRQKETENYAKFCRSFIKNKQMNIHFYKCKQNVGNKFLEKVNELARSAIVDGRFFGETEIYDDI